MFIESTRYNIWENESLDNKEIFKTKYDPKIDKLHKGNESEKLRWYIFAKGKNNSYRFLGKFKIDKINKNEIIYERKSKIVVCV